MSRLTAWKRWQAAAGPWRGWAMCPALTAPGVAGAALTPRPLPEGEGATGAAELAAALRMGGTAVVLDLEPVLGVRIAAEVSRQRLAHVVLVLPRWPHADAVLATDGLISTLVVTSAQLRAADDHSSVVFVFDGERDRSIHRPPGDQRVDNRYVLSVGEVPNLATLRAAGIRRVIKVTPRR